MPSPQPPLFKEIISWRQDCESSELWAKQQADRHGSTEPWVNNPGIMGTAAANVYFIMTNMVTAQLMQLRTVQYRGWQIIKWIMHRERVSVSVHLPLGVWGDGNGVSYIMKIC